MMKRQHPADLKKSNRKGFQTVIKITSGHSEPAPVLLSGYYLERVEELKTDLCQLNLLDNAKQISRLCREIMHMQKTLCQMNRQQQGIA